MHAAAHRIYRVMNSLGHRPVLVAVGVYLAGIGVAASMVLVALWRAPATCVPWRSPAGFYVVQIPAGVPIPGEPLMPVAGVA